jgi:lysyl endopeptidase
VQYGGRPITLDNQKVHWLPQVITMPGVDVQQMMAEDELNNATKDVPFRFGKNFDVNYNLNNSGTWHKLNNGDRVWLLPLNRLGPCR